MDEGKVAGRLLVEIEASAAGFANSLRRKVDQAASGISAKIGIDVDGEGLRDRLKAAVKEAAAGLAAKVKLDVDQDHLRTRLEGAVAHATDRVKAKIKATPDEDHLKQELARVVDAASRDERTRITVRTDVDRDRLVDSVRRRMREADGEVARGSGISIPFKLPTSALLYGGIVALVQPVVGALGQLAAGLTAMVGSALPAANTLAVLPGALIALGTALISTKILFGGTGDAAKAYAVALNAARSETTLSAGEYDKVQGALRAVAPALRDSVRQVFGLGDAWKSIKLEAQQRLFAGISREIGPLGQTLLPMVRGQLNGVADAVDSVLAGGARWMQTPIFRADFAALTRTNTRVTYALADSLGSVGHAVEDVAVSSGPYVERFANLIRRGADWMRTSAAAGRENGTLNQAMERGAIVGSSLGRSLRELGKGLGGTFKAGQEAGDHLLASMENALTRFDKWAHSDLGRSKMKAFFDGALPGFHEMVGLVGDIGKGLGRLASDGSMASMVSQVRRQLVPAIGLLINGLGRDLGPKVISVISNVVAIIGRLASGAAALAPVLSVFAGLANIFAGMLRYVPGLSTALGTLLVAWMALKAVQTIGGMFAAANSNAMGLTRTTTGLATSFMGFGQQMALQQTLAAGMGRSIGNVSAAVSVLQTHIPRLQATIPTVDSMNRAFYDTRTAAGGAASAMTGVGNAAKVGLRGAWTGLVSFMGGPLGLGIAAVSVGLGLLANWHQRVTAAADDQRRAQQNLSAALKETNGAITADVRTTAAQLLQDQKVLGGKEKLLTVMGRVNVGLPQLTSSYLGLNGGLKELSKTMDEQAEAATRAYNAHPSAKLKEQASNASRAAAAIRELSSVQVDEAAKTKQLNDAVNNTGRAGLVYEKLKDLVGKYSNATLDATARTDALKAALDLLAGGTLSLRDAQARADSAVLSAMQAAKSATDDRNNAIKEGTEYTKGWGKALLDAAGGLKTTTDNGQQLYQSLTSIRDASIDSTRAAYDLAISQKKTVPEALQAAKGEMGRLYDSAIKMAMGYGLSRAEAEKAATAMGLVPDQITTLLVAKGSDSILAQLAAVQAEYARVPGSKQITVQAMTEEAKQYLKDLGYAVTTLPNGNVQVNTTALSAKIDLQSVVAVLAQMPEGKNIALTAPTFVVLAELESVKQKVLATPDRTLTIDAPSQRAISQLQEVGFRVDRLNDREVRITAPSGSVSNSVNVIQQLIDGIRSKSVTITTHHRDLYSIDRQMGQANGNILGLARGAVRMAGGAVRAAADGYFQGRQARIASSPILWAEAGPEAYIPLSPGKRARSERLLERVAGIFGGTVVYDAARALGDGARALSSADLYRASRSAAPTVRTPSGPTSLVNGDLTIATQAGSVRNGLQEAMFELERMRLGGF